MLGNISEGAFENFTTGIVFGFSYTRRGTDKLMNILLAKLLRFSPRQVLRHTILWLTHKKITLTSSNYETECQKNQGNIFHFRHHIFFGLPDFFFLLLIMIDQDGLVWRTCLKLYQEKFLLKTCTK